jgi:NAD(P)H-flavin reductase
MMNNKNIYKPIRAKLTDVIDESALIKTFVLIPEEEFSFKTGQFIELSVDGVGEAPFTPSSSPLITEKLEVTVMKTGYVTEYMHMLKPGVFMGIRGPYGRGYPIDMFFGKEVLSLEEDAVLHLSGRCFTPWKALPISLKK